MSRAVELLKGEIQACEESLAQVGPMQQGISIQRDHFKEVLAELQRLQRFRSAVVGWREVDHPEGFSRRSAEWVANLGREAEGQ
jgi:hypothetical protein